MTVAPARLVYGRGSFPEPIRWAPRVGWRRGSTASLGVFGHLVLRLTLKFRKEGPFFSFPGAYEIPRDVYRDRCWQRRVGMKLYIKLCVNSLVLGRFGSPIFKEIRMSEGE